MTNTIPEKYLLWLKSFKGESIQLDDRDWSILSIDSLIKIVNIDGVKIQYYKILSSYASSFKEMTGANTTIDQNENNFSLDKLSKCISIGENNGDILFINPEDNNSVWCYYPAGGDVEKLISTFENLK